jgi:hypothetical protein
MLTAVVGVLGALTVAAWLVVAWQSHRRQPWGLAPLPLGIVALLALGLPGWALLPTVALAVGVFTELVIGPRVPPALITREPNAPLSTQRWAAAVAAPYRVALAEPWDVVVHPGLRRRYRRTLAREFGVADRASLLAAMDELWDDLHAEPDVDLHVDLRTGTAVTRGLDGAGRERRMLLRPEQVKRLRRITETAAEVETVVVRSVQWWRAVHMIRLACGGAALDWLSPAETQGVLRRTAVDLQRRFSGWDRLAQAFHGGYVIWDAPGREAGEPDRLWWSLGLLTVDAQSPWRTLPWDMPLDRGDAPAVNSRPGP